MRAPNGVNGLGRFYSFTSNGVDFFGQDKQRLARIDALYVGPSVRKFSFVAYDGV